MSKNKNKSGQTAFGVAMARLIEQYQLDETRLFNDPMLRHLLPQPFPAFMKIEMFRNWIMKAFDKRTKGIFGELICRTKYIDEKTLSVLNEGVQQILILGSGLDTRPYRIKRMKNVNVYEVDLSSVQNFKKERIIKHFGSLPSYINYVAIDFNTQTLKEVLHFHQFDFSKPTFIIWEGVAQYITKEAVEKVFDFISTLIQGSCVVFTYILESVIKRKSSVEGANDLVSFFEKKKWPWLFGLEPTDLKTFLSKYNLQLVEDVGASYYQQNYLRPIARQLNTTEIERVVFACR